MNSTFPADCDQAVVKMILSGDSLTLKHKDHSESTISLAYLVAPRLASFKKNTQDEPYAFEAREVLRRVLIGKDVGIRVEYTIPSTGRQFCSVYVKSPKTGDWVNVAMIALQMGYVKLRDEGQGRNDLPEEYPLLVEAQRRAKENGVGVWSGDASAPVISTEQGISDPAAFVKQYGVKVNKGKPLKAIIEHVRDGGSFRARLLVSPSHHILAWIQISGIRAPSTNPSDGPAEPCAEQAKDFLESRLLQREVDLLIEDVAPGTNASGAVLASVQHPAGNIAHFLLRDGLAKVHDWTVGVVTGGASPLRAAELHAKKQGLGVWAGHVDSSLSSSSASTKRFQAQIIRILGPELLLVKSLAPASLGKEFKLTLTSVRGPKREGAMEAWNVAAREHVRKLAIGKQAIVAIDYERPAQDGYEARTYATVVVINGSHQVNLATDLIAKGFAQVLRPRRGEDDNKAANLDELVVAEAEATEAKRGMHSGKPAPALPRYNDVCETPAKAKQFLPFLLRAKRVTGTVDHVINGSRLKVLVPRESAKVTLVVAGVRVPARGDAGADEALAATTEWAMQREIEFEVDGVDKTGAFISTIWVPAVAAEGGIKMRSLGTMLLENGRAYLNEYSADQSAYGNQLYEAERRGKEAQKGLWVGYDEAAEQEAADAAAKAKEAELVRDLEAAGGVNGDAAAVKKQLMHVCISEYLSGTHFYLQKMSADAVANLESLMSQFAKYHASHAGDSSVFTSPIKVGEYVSAQFTADNQWYRARVRKFNKMQAQVFYYDYGNSETVTLDRLRPLPPQFQQLPPQAQEAKLSYIRTRPVDLEYGRDALNHLRDLTESKKLIANLDKVQGGLVYVSLFDPAVARQDGASPIGLDFATSVNVAMVEDGFAITEKAPAAASAGPRTPKDFAAALKDAQDEARRAHVGVWVFGDIDEETF
ncbi:hypothetical protein BCR44DRAFT_89389 [Catenaria anguillulae PL171]|uniref:Transcription factor n=1 Tax=Catenaria anguillulae PL171 TaxID=765915 RepID=A0A1Y2HQ27_9FUNG|nr:hypothetical protein BCR44DRAFT_89389 [Catenaria anguillulae PL171]